MTEIVKEIRNTSVTRWILQLIAIGIGIAGSIALVVAGYLQEDVFEILSSPFTGIVNQIQILLLTQIGPTLILLIGCIGFIGLILTPGVILSRLLYSEMNGFTRILIGTSISMIVIFFPLSYGLLFGIAPSWLLILLPSILAIIAGIFNPEIFGETHEEFKIAVTWLRDDLKERKHLWFWIPLIFFFIVPLSAT